ncbi:hypothetical protein Tco_1485553 [Tanacetum coccineum]
MLRVSPWKGVVHFGKRGKLNPRYKSWTMKDVRFKDQQWKFIKGSLVEANRMNKTGRFIGLRWYGEAEEAFLHNDRNDKKTVEEMRRYNTNLQVKCLKIDNSGEYSSWPIMFCVENGIVMLKMVPETPLQFGSTKRLSRTFRA